MATSSTTFLQRHPHFLRDVCIVSAMILICFVTGMILLWTISNADQITRSQSTQSVLEPPSNQQEYYVGEYRVTQTSRDRQSGESKAMITVAEVAALGTGDEQQLDELGQKFEQNARLIDSLVETTLRDASLEDLNEPGLDNLKANLHARVEKRLGIKSSWEVVLPEFRAIDVSRY